MSYGRHSMGLIVAAITVLLTGSLVGSSELVLCIGADGHRALERDGVRCQAPAASATKGVLSIAAPEGCFDVPVSGGQMISSTVESERVPVPPTVLLPSHHETGTFNERALSAITDARAGPPRLALHLPSTVLLV